jgi:hypothetical protein
LSPAPTSATPIALTSELQSIQRALRAQLPIDRGARAAATPITCEPQGPPEHALHAQLLVELCAGRCQPHHLALVGRAAAASSATAHAGGARAPPIRSADLERAPHAQLLSSGAALARSAACYYSEPEAFGEAHNGVQHAFGARACGDRDCRDFGGPLVVQRAPSAAPWAVSVAALDGTTLGCMRLFSG